MNEKRITSQKKLALNVYNMYTRSIKEDSEVSTPFRKEARESMMSYVSIKFFNKNRFKDIDRVLTGGATGGSVLVNLRDGTMNIFK